MKLLTLSIGLLVFLRLAFKSGLNMNNLTVDYTYLQINVLIILYVFFFIFLYFTKRLSKYYYDFTLTTVLFMRSIQGHGL